MEHDPVLAAAEASRRMPRADLRRLLEMKHGTCIGLGCTRPGHGAEIDHTLEHGKGGPTVEANLAPACGHDHDLKTKGGWRLDRLGADRFAWTTRLGRRYPVTVQPVIEDFPAPGPAPGRVIESHPDPETDSTGRPWPDSTPWVPDPRQHDPRQQPRPDTDAA